MERNRLIDVLEVMTNNAPDQHADYGRKANVGSSASFAPAHNIDKASPSGMGIVDPTSTGDDDQADSDE